MIVTSFVYPAIPTRQFDWAAYNDDDCGCAECHAIVGRGETEAEAIADYQEQKRDEWEARLCGEKG